MKSRTHNFILALFVLGLCGCASTSIKQTWKSPAGPAGPVQKVAVIAVDERGDVRTGLENRFVRELRRRGQEATATVKVLRLAEIKADKDAAAARLREDGADAVLIVRLVDQATYSHQVVEMPALYDSSASGYDYCYWYDFFSYAYTGMGTISTSLERVVYLDSSLFDLKSGQRIWSALTQTVLFQDADALKAADKLAAKIARRLYRDDLVR